MRSGKIIIASRNYNWKTKQFLMNPYSLGFSFFIIFLSLFFAGSNIYAQNISNTDHQQNFEKLIDEFSNSGNRSSGSKGASISAQFIESYFKNLGFDNTGSQTFQSPVRAKTKASILIEKTGQIFDIDPFLSNTISPGTIAEPGLKGAVVHVGKGEIKDFNNKIIKDSIVLMDLDSGGNWINALSLGAKAIIYVYTDIPDKFLFKDKLELSPVTFPRFILSKSKADALLPYFSKTDNIAENNSADTLNNTIVTITSDIKWTNASMENIYCMIPGSDKEMDNKSIRDELIIVEGFYDTSGFIPDKSPGADQACSIASLLDLAGFLKNNPPKRSILLVATSGHGNSLAGMREMIWSIKTKSRDLKKRLSGIKKTIKKSEQSLALIVEFKEKLKKNLENLSNPDRNQMDSSQLDSVQHDSNQLKLIQDNIIDIIKTGIDQLSNRLMQLRLEEERDEILIKKIAGQRMALKRLESKKDLMSLGSNAILLIIDLIPSAIEKLERIIENTKLQKNNLQSAMAFKKLIKSKKIMSIISLHLSSHGNGIGAFNQGWLYDIKKTVNVFSPFVKLNNTILKAGKNTAKKLGTDNILKDTLRPSLHRPWQSFFKDTPALGGEVSRLAAFLGFTFATTNDSRQYWNTPHDKKEKMDIANAAKQSLFVSNLIADMASSNDLSVSKLPRNGFATLEGNASFLRHGAVFADAPAPGSMILSFQGPGIFYNMVDESGDFLIKGISTKKLTLHKVILEGYKFDKTTGNTIWAVDKNKTTKARYRVKVLKNKMKTDLVMFRCNQTTILNLLEPRTFQYMTKMQILDARMDAKPVRYWYSRIDTRSSLISSIYLQPGTRLKLSLSDSILSKKFILTHATKDHPDGNGYRIDTTPVIAPTQYLAAKDMWSMLNPRIDNLEKKGINNQKIKTLQTEGNKALKDANDYFQAMSYDKFFTASGNALALAGRVYDHVQSIQKDVLYGVLFYIMLFAPFAFCLERFLFAFINIYKRIAGFLCIMVVLITIIYNVHPAFELAYSPIVIILAFFIIGLSAMVTWIIFNRFENEMKRMQREGRRGNEGEISFLKAFAASFFMGLNNLRRRRTRTVLTCTTLIILTFTIMSFTSVKNIRQHSKLLYNSQTPYQGFLVKQINWKSLDERAFKIIENTMASDMIAAPRAWLDNTNRTQSVKIPVLSEKAKFQANGLIGLSHKESKISRLSDHIMQGRWFSEKDQYSIIIPERMARILQLPEIGLNQGDSNKSHSSHQNPKKSDFKEIYIKLWSIPFKVIGTFSGKDFDTFKDLDGEPITPAIFPDEIFQKTTETEMEALESGDDVKAFQSRYKHIPFDQTVIIPYKTLIALGGSLKSIALKYKHEPVSSDSTFQMADRFGLWLFSGEKKGVFLYNASDSLNYSGLPNVLIPVLISMFIVLNTMIGSVQERKREIGIYTSIGMAPSHVSIIFIAEALSYAVLSVVLGYILAQVVVTVFAGTSLLSGLTVNYSSLGGVFAMAMVMVVVILSSIYPSRVAASIAIPDVEKSWEMTLAKGNQLDIELPFLIKAQELSSVFGYLYELFDTHRAVSHGIFSVGRLKMDTRHTINFTAWLAPFDLGIMQQVTFNIKKSSYFKNYMEIDMTIAREAGEHNTWWRVNKRFVNLIRKQLLIWRSMDDSEKQTYQRLMQSIADKKDTSIA